MIAIPGTEVPGYFHGVPLGRENGLSGSAAQRLSLASCIFSTTDDEEREQRKAMALSRIRAFFFCSSLRLRALLLKIANKNNPKTSAAAAAVDPWQAHWRPIVSPSSTAPF
jgi:hypothetical protein